MFRPYALRLQPLALGIVIGGLLASCAPEPYMIRSPGERFASCTVAAEHHEDWMTNQQAASLLAQNGYCHYQIPGYHDQQQLTDGADGLGPVVWLFASPNIELFEDHVPFDRQWVNVAMLLRDPGDIPETYNDLGLEPQRTCMYLRHVHSGGQPYFEATVVEVPSTGLCAPSADALTGIRLSVTEEKPMPNVGNYPPVARFVEVSIGNARSHTMIGVRCGDAWCNAGPAGSVIPPAAHEGLSGAGASSRWRVKGWFDDQTLSVPNTSGPGLRRQLRASIVPVDSLGDITIASFRQGRRHVATVMIRPGTSIPPKYGNSTTGYGFVTGANRIELMLVDTTWQAFIVNSNHPDGLLKSAERAPHEAFDIPVPATARWRWSATDEQIWVRCDVGCCRVIENES